VVPIFHPTQVLVEPQHEYLFTLDIQNAIEQILIKNDVESEFSWNLIDTKEKLFGLTQYLPNDVAVDIETTGLDFLKDKIQTISLSFDVGGGKHHTVTIPIHHKEFVKSTGWILSVVDFLNEMFRSDTIKVLHKAQFDLKFLEQLGVNTLGCIYDTKIMQHLIDENLPKSLKDLVGYYFPSEQGII
jgi:DNA polymerase I-like protein with 3'-5' exonuclease and polymerase domains